ncbi:uncharacterized protein TNCV_4636611 [Trichonephila clavipes]|nr:uncharacterized protein TNCV_4636611 [Trichonephila clavipes]
MVKIVVELITEEDLLPIFVIAFNLKSCAVGSLVVRAPESRQEGLSSMPVPPNTLRVHTELVKSVGPNVFWAESRVQGTGEKFPSSSVPCLNCGGGDRWWRHLS